MGSPELIIELKQAKDIIRKRDALWKERSQAAASIEELRAAVRNQEQLLQKAKKSSRTASNIKTKYHAHADQVKKEVEETHKRKCKKQAKTVVLIVLAIFVAVMAGVIIYSNTSVKDGETLSVSFVVPLLMVDLFGGIFVWNKVMSKDLVWSEADKQRLSEAEQLDMEYAQYRANGRLNAIQHNLDNAKRKAAAEIPEFEKTVSNVNTKLSELPQITVIGANEQKIEIIDELIEILESHRAESLPDAFRIYDDRKRWKTAAALAQYDANCRAMDEKRRWEEQYERDMATASYRHRTEKLLKEQNEELEKIRNDEEYRRRYGQQ